MTWVVGQICVVTWHTVVRNAVVIKVARKYMTVLCDRGAKYEFDMESCVLRGDHGGYATRVYTPEGYELEKKKEAAHKALHSLNGWWFRLKLTTAQYAELIEVLERMERDGTRSDGHLENTGPKG